MSQLNLYKSFFYDQTRIWYSYKMSKQETYEVKEKLTLIIKHFYSTLSKVNLNNINFKIWLKWNCFHIYFNFLCKSTLVGVCWKWTNSYFYRNGWMSVKKGRKFSHVSIAIAGKCCITDYMFISYIHCIDQKLTNTNCIQW